MVNIRMPILVLYINVTYFRRKEKDKKRVTTVFIVFAQPGMVTTELLMSGSDTPQVNLFLSFEHQMQKLT